MGLAERGDTDELGGGSAPLRGWSTSGNLTTGNATQQFSLQCDFTKAAGPGSYTVQFGIAQPSRGGGGSGLGGALAQALIITSVKGNSVQRIVTIGGGTSVSVTGEALKVIVTDVSDAAFYQTGNKYNVSVQVAPGVRATTETPPTLVAPKSGTTHDQGPGFFELPAATTLPIPIPQNAGVVSVKIVVSANSPNPASPINASSLQANQQNSAAGTNGPSWSPIVDTGWIPIVGGMDTLLFLNPAGGQTLNIGVVYGIDG